MRSFLLPASLVFACACNSPAPQTSSVEPGSPPPLAERSAELPDGWRTADPNTFEEMAQAWAPAGGRTLTEAVASELAAALVPQDDGSIRAAVLLGRALDERSREILIQRLEARVFGPARASDAADCICAASLAAHALSKSELDRLQDVVIGTVVHPDVEVRVETARVLLAAGRDEVIPFLLTVLREGTLDQEATVAWERKPTMAWPKSRAAEALSERAGVPCDYHPDSSFARQAREATKLAQRLGY